MSMESAPPFSWSFNLGRIPVIVEPSFWLFTVLFWMMGGTRDHRMLVCWVAVCLVSILVHELGHALVSMLLGSGWAGIRLYSMGGLCYHEGLSRWRSVAVAAAGPLAGFLLYGLAFLVYGWWSPNTDLAFALFQYLKWVNIGWGIINLMPVPPLDGGHISLGVFGPTRRRMALWLGIITAGGMVVLGLTGIEVLGLSVKSFYLSFMFGWMGYGCYQALSTTQDLRPLKPVDVAKAEPDALARGWKALRSGDESEAARLGHLALAAAKPGEESNAVRDLLAWVALAEGNGRGALYQLEKVQPPQAARPFSLAMAYEATGLPERALPHALAALEKEPTEAVAALAVRLLVGAKRLDEAERVAREFAWKTPATRDSRLADVAAARGDFGGAAALYARAFESAGHAEDAYQSARAHALSGQVEPAAEWLERALWAGYDDLETLGQEPALAEVRALPRIAERLSRAGRGVA
jgi:Zn-dependent protease